MPRKRSTGSDEKGRANCIRQAKNLMYSFVNRAELMKDDPAYVDRILEQALEALRLMEDNILEAQRLAMARRIAGKQANLDDCKLKFEDWITT